MSINFYKLEQEAKNSSRKKVASQRTYMAKEKIPTQCKTKKCSICGMPGTTITVNNQKFIRCKKHIMQLNSKNDTYEPVFQHASNL